MAPQKKINLEVLILSLITKMEKISISDIAQEAGMSKSNESDRKAIRRTVNQLIERGLLQPEGKARARIYKILSTPSRQIQKQEVQKITPFEGIPFSEESKILWQYISRPLTSRSIVGYQQEFLRNYRPNKDFYLSSDERNELKKRGTVENKIRPAGTYARNILNRLLIDLSWNSSRLEGNTYSLLETKKLIEDGQAALGKNASETQMILNHKEAIEYIIESSKEENISSHDICSIHALLSENLLGDPSASGRIRQLIVGIGGTNYKPLENPHILQECFNLFTEKLNRIKDPFEQSFFSLVHLSYLQAFEDVNKRTARLVANISLIKNNLRPLSFTEVNNELYVKSLIGVYEKNDLALIRDLYIWAYKRSAERYSAIQQSMGEPNLLKLKYRLDIQEIIRSIILERISSSFIVERILSLINSKNILTSDVSDLFHVIEIEIMGLHEGNIARFKIRPSEFQEWKKKQ